jgi:hypothetical protein
VNGTPVQLANSALEQTSPRHVSTGSTSSGVGALLASDAVAVVVGVLLLVVLGFALPASSDDPPPQPAMAAVARTPASRQATRRRRVMPLIRPRSASRDSNDLAAVRSRQLCAMSTKRE